MALSKTLWCQTLSERWILSYSSSQWNRPPCLCWRTKSHHYIAAPRALAMLSWAQRSKILPRHRGTLKVFLNLQVTSDIFQKVAVTGQDLTRLRTVIIRHDKRKYVRTQCRTLIHCDSSRREQKNMFCVLRGDSFTFPASSPPFCHFCSPSFSLSPYPSVHIPWKAFHGWTKCICLSSSIPHCPRYGLETTSLDFFRWQRH